jgi:thiol-disulfide isomerase/thioredoxin
MFMNRNRTLIATLVAIIVISCCIGAQKVEKFETLEEIDKVEEPSGKVGGYTPRMLLYFAPWCPHSRKILPEWEKFQKLAKDQKLDVSVEIINSEDSPEEIKKANVQGFPTIRWIAGEDAESVDYSGPRHADAFLDFCKKQLSN